MCVYMYIYKEREKERDTWDTKRFSGNRIM